MILTKIRNNDGKLKAKSLQTLANALSKALTKEGFITDVTVKNSSSLKLGLHSRCFSINTQKLGHNAVIYSADSSMKFKKGYKRTNVPVWDQRVRFNDVVNDVLDSFRVSANIKSGPFTIRKGYDRGTEDSWRNEIPSWFQGYSTDVAVNGLGQIYSVRVFESQAKESQSVYDHV